MENDFYEEMEWGHYDGGKEVDPWRYRHFGPHPLAAGIAAQFIPTGKASTILEMGSAEGLLAMRVVGATEGVNVTGTARGKHIAYYLGLEVAPSAVALARKRAAREDKYSDIIKYKEADVSEFNINSVYRLPACIKLKNFCCYEGVEPSAV